MPSKAELDQIKRGEIKRRRLKKMEEKRDHPEKSEQTKLKV